MSSGARTRSNPASPAGDAASALVSRSRVLRRAASTRTASAVAETSWTRTAQAPRAAARADTAVVAASRARGGRGSPVTGSASNVPRNRLREAPTSTGRPSRAQASILASRAQSSSRALAKPSPGSTITCPGSTPPATTASSGFLPAFMEALWRSPVPRGHPFLTNEISVYETDARSRELIAEMRVLGS